MSYSIQDFENDLTATLHGTQISQIQNPAGLENRTARQLLLDIDPQETKRTVEFTVPLFNTVYDYPLAVDVKGNKIIDIIPQVNRLPRDIYSQMYNQGFDVSKQNIYSLADAFTMDFNTGIKSIRINSPFLAAPNILNQMESTTSNGTWTAGGTASGLTVNNTNFVQGAGSLQVNVTTGAAYVETSTMSAVDLSTGALQTSFFVWVYIPDATKLTSVNLRIGSSSTNYYTATITQNQQSTSFQNGWNLCQFIWSTMSVTGTPNTASITYARVTINVTGTMNACLFNGLDSILGSILSYEYYSKYLFRDSITGAFQETVTDPSNLINLDTDSYNLFFNLGAFFATQQQQGLDATFYDGNFFGQEYQKGVALYKLNYRSEVQKPQTSYYQPSKPGYGRYLGRNNY